MSRVLIRIRYCLIFKLLRCPLVDSLFILPRQLPFVNPFFEVFQTFFQKLSLPALVAAALPDSLFSIPPLSAIVNPKISFLFNLDKIFKISGRKAKLQYYLDAVFPKAIARRFFRQTARKKEGFPFARSFPGQKESGPGRLMRSDPLLSFLVSHRRLELRTL